MRRGYSPDGKWIDTIVPPIFTCSMDKFLEEFEEEFMYANVGTADWQGGLSYERRKCNYLKKWLRKELCEK